MYDRSHLDIIKGLLFRKLVYCKKILVKQNLMDLFSINVAFDWLIGLVGSVFTNGPGDLGSIPGRVIPKT